MWTLFWDMHSGGGQKEKWAKIYIEAPEDEARVIFYNRFGHSPDRVTCTCCGEDYSVSEEATLEQASAYHRGCAWVSDKDEDGGGHYIEEWNGKSYETYMTVEEYGAQDDVLYIHAADIKPQERIGNVPTQDMSG